MPQNTEPWIRNLREGGLLCLDAGAIVDGHACDLRPASMLLRVRRVGLSAQPPAIDSEILAVDAPSAIDTHPDSPLAVRVDLTDSLLIPGLVNAHAHLDLTHIGPRPHDPADGFIAWVEHVRSHRAIAPGQIEASVREGVALSLVGGTVAIGDIAGAPAGRPSLIPNRTLRASPLAGVSYLEFFAIGTRESASLDAVQSVLAEGLAEGEADDPVRLGLQPHALYSVSPSAYRWAQEQAQEHGLAVATHLAETVEEREFIGRGEGPQRAFLESLGLWNDELKASVGRGLDPVAHLADVLAMGPITCAHVNDAGDAAIDTLARSEASVVYCPRASAYFGAETRFGPHRYRDMLDAGVNVALGSDSIINLPADTARRGISIFDEMRLLHRRDGVEPRRLLAMATLGGAASLGLDPTRFRFDPGFRPMGIVRVPIERVGGDPLREALAGEETLSLLFHGNISGLAGIGT